MPNGQFQLPIWFDLAATCLCGLTGALAARRRGYDFIGLFALALATGLGGGLIRDGLFLQQGPPAAVTDARYLLMIGVAGLVGIVFGERLNRLQAVFELVDALALGAYAVVGADKSLHAGLGGPAAVLVGVVNAVGGGVLRDVLAREEPLIFKPGQYYAAVALVGGAVFVVLTTKLKLDVSMVALIAIGLTFVLRALVIRYDWRTSALTKPRDVA